MNQLLLRAAGCLALTICTIFAGDDTTKRMTTILDDAGTSTHAHPEKTMEFRIGPAFNYTDASIESGRRAQGFNLKDIGFDEINYGAKTNFDWEFAKKYRWNTAFTWFNYNQSGSLKNDLTWGTGNALLKGSQVRADIQIYQLETKIGYDLCSSQSYRFTPYFGLKGEIADGEVAATSGTQRREQGKITTIDKEKLYDKTELFGNYLIGFESEYRIINGLYVGVDFGGYYMGDFFGGVAKGYVGYDIDEVWTVRVGLDSEYANIDYRKVESDGFSNTAYAQMGIKF